MATQKIDVGAANVNPNTGVKSPRKKKVTPPRAADPAPAVAPVGTARLAAALAAVRRILALLVQIEAEFAPFARPVAPIASHRVARISATQEGLIPRVADLLRNEPVVGPASAADELDGAVAYLAGLRQLGAKLVTLDGTVAQTVRGELQTTWTAARGWIATAARVAKTDGQVANALAPIRQVTQHGPRVVTAQATAVAGQATVARTARQLARSQQKAAIAQERADMAKRAQTLAAQLRAGVDAAPAPVPVPHTG